MRMSDELVVTLTSNCSVSIVCPKAVSEFRIEMMCSFDGLRADVHGNLLFDHLQVGPER